MFVKKLSSDYVSDILRIDSECFSNPWSEDTVSSLLKNSNACVFGALEGDLLIGYVALEWVLDEGSLTNLAVLPEFRRNGVAESLLQELLAFAESNSLQFVTLEVRASNIPAMSLYRKLGFKEVGKRLRYYSSPIEDALLMTKYLNII
ncbi:MAG: ribosomal protein S18-alanine N-acetyltransferase [Clostridia bacterium]|nr:ribosomal protein S18-alanine N-acetyltransferase [Clostridia bacterium]